MVLFIAWMSQAESEQFFWSSAFIHIFCDLPADWEWVKILFSKSMLIISRLISNWWVRRNLKQNSPSVMGLVYFHESPLFTFVLAGETRSPSVGWLIWISTEYFFCSAIHSSGVVDLPLLHKRLSFVFAMIHSKGRITFLLLLVVNFCFEPVCYL